MKKIALVLCAALAATSIVGCGEQKKTENDVATITYWSGNTHSKAVYEALVNEFNQGEGKEKGIYIDYQVKDSASFDQTMELALQSGDAPDLIGSGNLEKMVLNDYIMPIDDLPNGADIIAGYDGYLFEKVTTYKGKTYGLPYGATTQGLVYNKDMFKAAGIVDENGEATPPKTFGELREYAKRLTDNSKKQYGIILPLKWTGWFSSDITSPALSSLGREDYNPVTGKYDYEALVPIMQTFLDMRNDGSVFPGADGIDNDQARANFSAGNVGMKFAYSFDVGVFNDQFPAKCDWGVAPYPVLDEGDEYLQRMDYGTSFMINKQCAEKFDLNKIETVLKFFTSDEFAIETYKAGVDLPYKWDIVKDVKLEDAKEGWAEFAALADISTRPPDKPSTDFGADLKISDRFLNDVWNGSMTPQELAVDYNKVITDATEKYYSIHTDESADDYIIPDWNIKR